MPFKKPYTSKTVGMGASRTPDKVMGGQGKPASIADSHHKSRPTKTTTFEQGTAPRGKSGRKASGRHNPPNSGKRRY